MWISDPQQLAIGFIGNAVTNAVAPKRLAQLACIRVIGQKHHWMHNVPLIIVLAAREPQRVMGYQHWHQQTGKKNRRWGPPENKSKGSFKGTLTLIADSTVSSAVFQKICNDM
jgi:hypothetical protein